MPTEPRPLATEISKHGHVLKQSIRTATKAIYTVRTTSDKLIGYEVIRIKIANEQKLPNGSMVPLRETYPSDEDFGRSGWYYMHNQAAGAKAHYESLP